MSEVQMNVDGYPVEKEMKLGVDFIFQDLVGVMTHDEFQEAFEDDDPGLYLWENGRKPGSNNCGAVLRVEATSLPIKATDVAKKVLSMWRDNDRVLPIEHRRYYMVFNDGEGGVGMSLNVPESFVAEVEAELELLDAEEKEAA